MDSNMTDQDYIDEKIATLSAELDLFFLVIMGMCVYFMQCGFAFLEAGAVRSKNTTNILIKNVMDSFVSGVSYWLFGYAFAFGDGGDAQKFIGLKNFASSDMEDTRFAEFFFQYTFAATAATIVSGAVAERCEFFAYFVYSFCITGFIYPVVTHWTWGGGWLGDGLFGSEFGEDIPYQDFAGSGIVHVLGGVAAFVGAALLGPRIGRFNGNVVAPLRGHSVPIAALGGFVLFFGFLAFNGGSQLAISNEGDGAAVAISVVNTIISGSFAAFGSLIINRLQVFGNSWSLLSTLNGALTGMVAACAGCNAIAPWGACILGILASFSFTLWSTLMKKFKVDDPLDAVAVHFGGGSLGVIMVAFLDKKEGILMAADRKSGYKLAVQLIALLTIIVWTATLSLLVFGILKLLRVLRVSPELEKKGLDIPKHNEPAYPPEAYGHGHIERLIQILENAPMNVAQVFPEFGEFNNAFENEVKDEGPYENPEANQMSKIRNRNHNQERANGQTVTNHRVETDDGTRM